MEIKKENVVSLLDKKFIKVFDIQYKMGSHYYNATRRDENNLVCTKTKEQFQQMKPDAVSCVLIDETQEKIVLTYEYRYPTGQFLLSVPAGLMDEKDTDVLDCAIREIKEECGLDIQKENVKVINPLLFSSPGMSDESNALVCALCKGVSGLNSNGAQGSELFDGFVLLSKEEAKEILKNGKDANGIYYSIFTWAALSVFVYDMWK